MSMGLEAGYGALSVENAITDLLVRQAEETHKKRQQAEIERRNLADEGLRGRGLDQDDQRIALDRDEFGLNTDRHNQNVREWDEAAPMRAGQLRYHNAQSADIERRPQAEAEEREYNTNRDRTQHGYRMGEIGAQGQNSLATARQYAENQEDARNGRLVSKVIEKPDGTRETIFLTQEEALRLGSVPAPTPASAKPDEPFHFKGPLRWINGPLGLGPAQPAQPGPVSDGAAPQPQGGPKVGDTKEFPNGAKGRWDGTDWELVQ